MQPPQTNIAELNFGILRHDWDDPRIADFAEGIAPVMALAERADGFVMWWVPVGHIPTINQGVQRLRHFEKYGSDDFAFDWSGIEDAKLWKSHGCAHAAHS